MNIEYHDKLDLFVNQWNENISISLKLEGNIKSSITFIIFSASNVKSIPDQSVILQIAIFDFLLILFTLYQWKVKSVTIETVHD